MRLCYTVMTVMTYNQITQRKQDNAQPAGLDLLCISMFYFNNTKYCLQYGTVQIFSHSEIIPADFCF